MMSHRKVRSQGNVPFSWEAKPGVSKLCYHHFPVGLEALSLQPSLVPSRVPTPFPPPSPSPPTTGHPDETPKIDVASVHNVKIPPPPCRSQDHPRRNASAKGVRWGEDPFLAAYKECTKSVKNGKKGKLSFSCKNKSCEVRDDSFLKISQPPKLRRVKIHV